MSGDDKAKRDRSALLRMAGNIASGFAARADMCGINENGFAYDDTDVISELSVKIARAIIADIDHLEPRQDEAEQAQQRVLRVAGMQPVPFQAIESARVQPGNHTWEVVGAGIAGDPKRFRCIHCKIVSPLLGLDPAEDPGCNRP